MNRSEQVNIAQPSMSEEEPLVLPGETAKTLKRDLQKDLGRPLSRRAGEIVWAAVNAGVDPDIIGAKIQRAAEVTPGRGKIGHFGSAGRAFGELERQTRALRPRTRPR